MTVFAVPMSMARLRPNGFCIYRTSPSTAYLGEFDFRPNPAFDGRSDWVNIRVGLCLMVCAAITSRLPPVHTTGRELGHGFPDPSN